MKTKILYSALIAFALSSCSNFLDVKPQGKLIPTEAEELGNLMNHGNVYDWFYLDNNIGCSYGYLSDNVEMSTTQQQSFRTSNSNMDRYAAYIYFEPLVDPNAYYYYTWNWNYRAINIFNTIIDGIADLGASQKGSEPAKQIIAQAKAARAFHYLVGAVANGPMWDPAGDNSMKVMPYRTTSAPTVPNPDLSDTEDLFAKIWTDLDEALADIPDLSGNPVRANKAAVHAMRAQYYMYKRDWSNMLTEANNSWTAAGGDASKLFYNLNDFRYKVVGTPPTDGTDHAVTLSLEYAPGGTVVTTEPFSEARSRENLFWRRGNTGAGIYPSESFVALFDKDNDLRYKLFMLKTNGTKIGTTDDGIRLNYLRGSKTITTHGITYPEVLLMRAEAYARTNKLTEALADLNTLRSYRYVKAPGAPATATDHPDGTTLLANQDQMIEEILKERRRELPYHSFHRPLDLKRYFHDTGKPWRQTTLIHMIGTTEYRKVLDKHSLTLPLTNEILKYNPHWGLPNIEGYWTPGDH